jgi:two-component system nitrate/nitrite response regulator NarL
MRATRPAKLPSPDVRTRSSTRSTVQRPLLRVLLADDHRLILNAVRLVLEHHGGFEVVAEATSVSEVLPLVRHTHPDIVLLDIRIAGMDGLVCLDQIKKSHPEITVIVLSVSSDPDVVGDALTRGASAYIIKSVNPIDLPAVIHQAINETLDTPFGQPDDTAASAAKTAGLTPRELTILTALAQGFSNTTIANQFSLAPQTVKYHLTNIYRKLRVANRIDAARYAYQQGLVERPSYETEGRTIR